MERVTTKVVLVTGGAGFIGSHVARYCVQSGWKVVVLDELSGGFQRHIPDGAEFIHGSVTDHELLDKLFERCSFDFVYHLAAYAAEGLSHFIRRFNYTNNVIGSVNVINGCIRHNVKCLVFTSSIAVYGAVQMPATEDQTPMPEDPYGIAKYSVELDLAAAHRIFGLNYVIFRPHNVYGKYQNIGDPYRNVIGIFMNQVMQGKPMTIFGDGSQTRAFSYIEDIVPTIARSPEVPAAFNQVFNIGADKAYTVLDLAHRVAAAFGVEPNLEFLPPRNEVQHAFSNHDKASKVFGSTVEVALDDGLARMRRWVIEHGPQQGTPFPNVEVSRNMPPSWTNLLKAEYAHR